MSAPPYMKFYVAEYLAETTTLNASEHGAYLLLLLAMWRARGKLPRDDVKLSKIARCTPEQWAEIKENVLPFFQKAGGSIKHRRITKEMAKYQAIVDSAVEAGKASARQRVNKNNTKSSETVQRKSNQIEPESRLGGINPPNTTRRESAEARHEGASALRVIAGQDDDAAWREALAEAERDLPHFEKTDSDFASEIAEFISTAQSRLALSEQAA